MKNKDAFKKWILNNMGERSNAGPSYLTSLEWLSEKFYQKGKIETKSIYNVESTDLIESLYTEVLQIQKDKSSYIFNNNAPGYGNKGFYSASLAKYNEFLKYKLNSSPVFVEKKEFNVEFFQNDLSSSGLRYTKVLNIRFTASLITKPFVILTGLSGSGKTKLAQAFVQWICQDNNQYSIIPVGADWTNREPLLGYPNALDAKEYVKPDSKALDLIIKANENKDLPYFLILDEMNLSHVERYFADFLSIMESEDSITLYSGAVRNSSDGLLIPSKVDWPKNLFMIGTVNIDETTYMFSPKVLDRANVIEFRISKAELEMYLGSNQTINFSMLKGKGANMAADFVKLAKGSDFGIDDDRRLNEALVNFFIELKKTGAEFGYRSVSEIRRFVGIAKKLDPDWDFDSVIDAAIMQKLLPKLHGSRSKLVGVLETLARICLNDSKDTNVRETYFDAFKKVELDLLADKNVKFPISLEKICRMHKNVVDNGFTSYAEA
ncbi:McrB family protein [Lunatibacter salilacus]|uniref:McrB family protein n=1 Tax=Lunatibacter salilacus TaxID=2483804 RepID=UPI00131BF08B|nr:hypothetical protein [Lunatibacter salilacus]